jgi:hypothetical protein
VCHLLGQMKLFGQIFLGLLLTFSCSGQKSNDRQLIEKSIHKFYDWYIGTVNNGSNYKLTQPVKGTDGMTKLDSKLYFDKLESIGTVSEQFINSVTTRLKVCDNFLKTVTWEKFQQGEGYEYDDKCDFLYFYYWIFSQEKVDGIQINEVTIDKNTSLAQLTFKLVENGKEVTLDEYNILVSLEKQGTDWFINEIKRK